MTDFVKINKYFKASEGAEYTLISESVCSIKKGVLRAPAAGATAYATTAGAYAYAPAPGATAYANAGGRVVSDRLVDASAGVEYTLFTANGLYFAGCAVGLTAAQALKRWDRDDDRALLFTFAIALNEELTTQEQP